MSYRSWGYAPPVEQRAVVPAWRDEALAAASDASDEPRLAFGNGRSYGDTCLNTGGRLIDMRGLDRFIEFDREAGVLCAEAGVTLATILDRIVPAGWFLPVTPGTAFATLGGAIANDVHGKNHHRDGCFGRHVREIELVRSSGDCLSLTPEREPELFRATIGGLGLTGLITRATIELIPIDSAWLDVDIRCFEGLDAYERLSAESEHHRYTVAWLDCVARGDAFARGVFLAADHAPDTGDPRERAAASSSPPRLSVPVALPRHLLNRHTVGAFNALYYRRHRALDGSRRRQHYRTVFHPLDAIGHWNRIYGARGFYQYQFVVPFARRDVLESVLHRIVDAGLGSFLAVLKNFGDLPSPGLLSFPRAGYCLALDFADRGRVTEQLLSTFDREIMSAGGAVYPAKDRTMSSDAFRRFFPAHERFEAQIDPAFTSDFWHRVHD